MQAWIDRNRFAIFATAAFIAISVFGNLYHEFWRDEAFTWLIINASSSALDLINKLAFVGHPKSWYLLIYFISRLYNNYVILIACNIFFMAAAIFIFCAHAPFTKIQKILFSLGFFPLYQYGLISRQYTLFIFLIFAYCALRPRLLKYPITMGILLAALASIHAHSFIACIVILLIETIDHLKNRDLKLDGRLIAALLIIFCSLSITAYQLIPPSNRPVGSFIDPNPFFVFKSFANGFFPSFGIIYHHQILQTIFGLSIWLLSWSLFRRMKLGMAYYLIWTLSLASFTILIYKGFRWHHGFYFIYFISAYWIAANNSEPQSRYRSRIITFILFIHMLLGLYAFSSDIRLPSSSGFDAAQFIKNNNLSDLPIIGINISENNDHNMEYRWDIDDLQSTIVYLNHKQIFDPIEGRFVDFWKHYSEPDYYTIQSIDQISLSLNEISGNLRSNLLILAIRSPYTDSVTLPEKFRKLIDLDSGFHYGESLSLFIFDGDTSNQTGAHQ